MTMTARPRRLARCAVVVAVCGPTSASLASAGLSLTAGPARLETTLAGGIAYAGAWCTAYLALTTLVVALEGMVIRGTPRTARALPGFARRFVTGGVAVAVALGSTLPASASEAVSPGWAPPTTDRHPAGATVPSVAPEVAPELAPTHPTPAPVPERIPGPARVTADETPRVPGTRIHAVTKGESLWSIAAQQLGPGAPLADIAHAWPIIYQANRSVIGDDPGLIRPGQRLVIPADVAS